MLKLTALACCLLLAFQEGVGQSTTPAGTGGSGSGTGSGTGGGSKNGSGSGTGGGSSSGTGGGSSSGTGGGSSSGTGGGSQSGTGGGSSSGTGGGSQSGSSSGTGGGSQSGSGSQTGSGTGGGSSTGQQNVKSNYYVDYFSSIIFVGYAIDQCSSYDLTGLNYIYPHCTSTSTITVSYYTAGSCSGSPSSTLKLNSSSNALFSCSQSANNYAKVSFGISGTCGISVYAAADACVPYSSYYASFSCMSSTSGAFKIFSSNQCSTSVTQYRLNSTCYSPFSISGTAVDFQLSDCYLGTTATTTSTITATNLTSNSTTSSSAYMIGLQNIIGVLLIVVCIAFAAI